MAKGKFDDLKNELAKRAAETNLTTPIEEREMVMPLRTELIYSVDQSRTIFDEDEIQELANDIRKVGRIISPILVRKESEDRYIIVAGEKRWRAAKILNLESMPVTFINLDINKKEDKLKLDLINFSENEKRSGLTPVEKGVFYKKMMEEQNLTQVALSELLGISRSAIANAISVAGMSDFTKKKINERLISDGHAKVYKSLTEAEQDIMTAIIIEEQPSVRLLEEYIGFAKEGKLRIGDPVSKVQRLKENQKMIEATVVDTDTKDINPSNALPGTVIEVQSTEITEIEVNEEIQEKNETIEVVEAEIVSTQTPAPKTVVPKAEPIVIKETLFDEDLKNDYLDNLNTVVPQAISIMMQGIDFEITSQNINLINGKLSISFDLDISNSVESIENLIYENEE